QYQRIVIESKPKTLVVTETTPTLVVIKSEPKDTIDDNNESQHSDSMSETFETMDDNSSDTQLESTEEKTCDGMEDNDSQSDDNLKCLSNFEAKSCASDGSEVVKTLSAKIRFKTVVGEDGRQWFGCNTCGNEYEFESQLHQHWNQMHFGSETEDKNSTDALIRAKTNAELKKIVVKDGKQFFVCKICNIEFKYESTLDNHCHKVHNQKGFRCDQKGCSYEAPSKRHLRGHLKSTHKLSDKPEIVFEMMCPVDGCAQVFASSNELAAHRVYNHTICLCSECGEEFVSRRARTQHIQSHHKEKHKEKHKCHQTGCQYETYIKTNLSEHQKMHQNIREFRCEVLDCGRSFYTKRHLKRHAVVHSDERPFTCDWPACEATFKTNRVLRDHRLIHEGIQQFKCPHIACDKSFVTRGCLSTHRRSHRNEKPYGCDWPECGQRFATNRTLKKHMNEHQGLRPYSCQYSGCDKSFSGKPGLRNHMKVVHKHNVLVDTLEAKYQYIVVESKPRTPAVVTKSTTHDVVIKYTQLESTEEKTCDDFEVKNNTSDGSSGLKTQIMTKCETNDIMDEPNNDSHEWDDYSDTVEDIFEMIDDYSSDTHVNNTLLRSALSVKTSDGKCLADNCVNSSVSDDSARLKTLSAEIPFKVVVGGDGRRVFVCNTCGNEYEIESQLHQHWEQMHFHCDKDANTCDPNMRDGSLRAKGATESAFKKIVIKNDKKVFICKICDIEFTYEPTLDKHCYENHGQKGFRCDQNGCQYEGPSKSHLRTHLKRGHKRRDNESYVCPVDGCGQVFIKKRELSGHQLSIHTVCQCEVCGEEFAGQRERSIHRRSHNQMKHKCHFPDCTFVTDNNTSLTHHRSRHLNVRQFRCEVADCGHTFVTINELKRHSLVHSVERPFACDWPSCAATFKIASLLNAHLLIHKGIRQFECPATGCGKSFVTKDSLLKHKLLHSDHEFAIYNMKVQYKKLHKCGQTGCDYETDNKTIFTEHQKRHQNIREFSCEVPDCGRSFYTVRELKRHAVVHSYERPFTCDWPACEATFKTSDCLNNHRLTHEAIRQFKCSETGCDKSFVTRRCLSSHRRCHRNEKPYGCDWPECGQRFASNQAFRAHVNEHQGIRPYSCQYSGCDKSFGGKPGFRQHMKVVHKHSF
ncbi:unnamed protein product, partial [Medioppia subpectinata]